MKYSKGECYFEAECGFPYFHLTTLFKEALRIYSVFMCVQINNRMATNRQFSMQKTEA